MLHLRVVSINSPHLMNMMRKPDGTWYADRGIELFLLQILSETIPFSYTLMNKEDNNFGSIDETGRWTGMIGMLERNETDIAIGWMSIEYARQKVVDYCFPYLIDKSQIVMSAPKILHNENAFLYPFHYLVWIIILASIQFSALVVSTLKRLNSSSRFDLNVFASTFLVEIGNIAAILLSQGSYRRYKKDSTRIFISMWSLVSVVLGLSYSCTLLSNLVAPMKEIPLKSVHELRNAVMKGEYYFGVFNGSLYLNDLMAHKRGDLKDLADHVRSHPENIVNGYDKAMHRIMTEKFAIKIFHLYSILIDSRYDLKNFHTLPDSVGFSQVGVAFRKGFPFMEKVNKIIHRITETGLYHKQMQDMIFRAKLKRRHQSSVKVQEPLSLADVDALLMYLILGLVLSTCWLLTEIMYKKYTTA